MGTKKIYKHIWRATRTDLTIQLVTYHFARHRLTSQSLTTTTTYLLEELIDGEWATEFICIRRCCRERRSDERASVTATWRWRHYATLSPPTLTAYLSPDASLSFFQKRTLASCARSWLGRCCNDTNDVITCFTCWRQHTVPYTSLERFDYKCQSQHTTRWYSRGSGSKNRNNVNDPAQLINTRTSPTCTCISASVCPTSISQRPDRELGWR